MSLGSKPLLGAIGVVCLAALLNAQNQSNSDPATLADETLDQLLNTPVVTVSKRQQRLSRVPAAVYVITKEEIRRSGTTSIPELLRLAPGVQVARINATQWAVSIRGFNGLWSNKLLVMIDGRTIYSEVFSGVDWEMQDVVQEDIERIEVVRGPGSSVWGANAVNGVINIVTKQAGESSGGTLSASTGNLVNARTMGQYGGAIGDTAYRVYAKFQDVSLPSIGNDARPDTHRQVTGGFRLDAKPGARDKLTIQGDSYIGETRDSELQPVALPSFLPQMSNIDGHPAFFDLQAKWARTLSDGSEISVQTFGAHEQRIEHGIDARDSTFDVEMQHSFRAGERNSFLWGLEARTIEDRIFGTPVFYFSPVNRTDVLIAGFVSDDISLASNRLTLSLGTKLEKYSFTSLQPEPSVRLAYTPDDNQTFWASVGRAVRIPSRLERDIHLDASFVPGPLPVLFQVVGNPRVASETLVAYEAGHRIRLGRKISLDTAAYINRYGTLRSTQELAPEIAFLPFTHLLIPLQYSDLTQGRSLGIENSANWDVSSTWRLTSSYSFGDLNISPKAGNNSSLNLYQNAPGSLPRHQAQVHSYWDITPKLQLDAAGYFVDRLVAQNLPSYTTTDIRLGWRPSSRLEFNAAVNNIFNRIHGEWITNDDLLYRGRMLGRTGSVTATWHF